jgi:dTDP-4-amino-4,6-dideoxygalactose transaminase
MIGRIPFLSPSFPNTEDVAADYAAIRDNGVFSNGGPFETAFASRIDRWIGNGAHSCVVSSGTTGLELAVRTTFASAKRYGLVASFTFAAAPLVLHRCGFEPLFLDIDLDSWQPKRACAEETLSIHGESVAGIILTNTFGMANEEVTDWEDLANTYGLPLIIDSAAGFGSSYLSGEPLGARGTCEVFSLHATKTLAVGEGGVVTARDANLIDRINRMKNFGFDQNRAAAEIGLNGKLSELSCAIGLRQLSLLPRRLLARQRVFRAYADGLRESVISYQSNAIRSALPFFSALMPSPAVRDGAIRALDIAGVEARMYYNPPVHQQSVFVNCSDRGADLPATTEIASRVISLPMSDHLSEANIARIVDVCSEVADGQSN